ncbi:MAG: hypothetical protein UX65_C0002G0029 [Parcubacteria group bacterium GW2011_GWB1_46_8]|nr:MAG: hypothetical protein UX14_C0004G0020 [Parcubacteria group bacterium GW2011_GWF1_45_5]KKU11552.1 MAG: hypothetical protein UX15_C0002G0005 [Parcubacteria group bacterium GW2011_GWA1_45_7]KKU44371.1 MAG: hypothetical protein UX61_C0002G0014 [Parcubacteria group bacterium GW2011_GWA2_46_7]KKU46555.1 MAG: hypothetical protein UX65_C0002G0029 [Parcubacteria group bacterium GW2011_GWB1_46_8]KKU48000.1 MAG: hypothetical protein UX66_C0001G0019 [Parcubacteria group bacterium GW2011_GWF2_46_8]
MCRTHSFGGPPYGIPIPAEVYEQFPQNVKDAYKTFDDWWQNVLALDNPVSRKDMPANIAEALETIKAAPIPGHEGATGADSCYINGVEMQFAD